MIDLTRRPDESPLDYHRRLVYGKLKDKTLAEVDYTELSEFVYGKRLSSDVARREMYGSRQTLELVDAERLKGIDDASVLDDIEQKMIELKKERQKFFDYRNAYNKVIREEARKEEIGEILSRAIEGGCLPELEYSPVDVAPSSNDLLVSLNDIHYGACFNNHWGEYNSDICRAMMEKYLGEIIRIAETHQSENCIVWENGDAISGNAHLSIQVSNKENVIEQVTGVSELIAEFLSVLSSHFKTVTFVSVPGNHSRLNPNKDKALHTERLDDLIEWYLKARLQNFENVYINTDARIDPTMYLVNIRGKNYLGVHGDYEAGAAKVQALQTMAGMPLYAVLSGHWHHNNVDTIQGVKTIMAGSFQGMDDYCIQKRIYGKPEQLVCVCDEEGVRCYYDVPL